LIGSTRRIGVYAFGSPTDLRKGFDGLSGLVTEELGQDPLSGDLFLFVNRSQTLAKVLVWDGTGLCVYSKRLEQGRFACLWRQPEQGRLRLTLSELSLFLEGSKLVGRMSLSPPSFLHRKVSIAAEQRYNRDR
jgi:transposase